MHTLRNSPASPFGRKVVASINMLGLNKIVQMQNADTLSDTDSLRAQNPLGKIPTLVLEDGRALFDSNVIVEYLNELDGRHLLIPQGEARIWTLKNQAFADGLMDAAILKVYEGRFRPKEHHVQAWLDHQQGKIDRALNYASETTKQASASQSDGYANIGDITLACALGYLDFRAAVFPSNWRTNRPALEAWFTQFHLRVPSFADSAPA